MFSVDDHETDFEYEGSDNDEEDHTEGDPRSVEDTHWSDLKRSLIILIQVNTMPSILLAFAFEPDL